MTDLEKEAETYAKENKGSKDLEIAFLAGALAGAKSRNARIEIMEEVIGWKDLYITRLEEMTAAMAAAKYEGTATQNTLAYTEARKHADECVAAELGAKDARIAELEAALKAISKCWDYPNASALANMADKALHQKAEGK